MDDHYYNVSRRLYDVLDWVGASDEMRRTYEEFAMVDEILTTIRTQHTCLLYGTYVFGSSCEGTTTPGLNSDFDVLHSTDVHVVERISDAPRRGMSYVMVRDESTKPGYVKLQGVFNGVGQTIYQGEPLGIEDTDQQGRICLIHTTVDLCDDLRNTEINGPAKTIYGGAGLRDVDIVVAYKCAHIPTFAQSWMSREKPHSWPRPHQIDKMKRTGCFLVGVNHPSSRQNALIEWRVSFSLQERELMLTLNPTQHKCYVLLKLIKKDIIHKSVTKSISSYHCKTCLFYVIENTPAVFWARRNLLECTRVCIKLLLHWVREQNCPNYFIPEENMFDKLQNETLRKVETVLKEMLEHWGMFLWSLSCDGIGSVLYDVLYGSGPGVLCVRNGNAIKKNIELYSRIQNSLYDTIFTCVHATQLRSPSEFLNHLFKCKLYLIQTNHVTEHTEEDTRLAISFFMPHLHLQIAQCLASIMLNIRDERLVRIVFRAFMYCISESRDLDLISTNLIVASFCLQSGRFETCERYLLDCEIALRPHILSMCSCEGSLNYFNDDFSAQLNMETFKQFRTCIAGCLTFPPCLSNLVPPALRYEMIRSVGTPSGSRDERIDYLFDWIVVDPNVYLYFLQYTLYTYTNKPVCKQDALDNLVHVIRRDINLKHRETAYNVLGWIYKQEHKVQQAMDCFLTSWRIRPDHNAAKWHMIELIRSVNMSV